MATAVQWFVEGLRRRGVEWIATLCGHGLDPFFHAARRAGLRLVDTRNEQTAAYAAESWGRLTRTPAVCAVSSGVAHANAMSGVVDAWLDRAPLVEISGAGALATAGMGHFQDLDQAGLAAPATKYSRVIDRPERVWEILDRAFEEAAQPPPGPVHLTFPMDIQNAEIGREQLVLPVPWARPSRPREDPEQAARALTESERPLVIAGSGVYYAGTGGDVLDFCERFSIPLAVPIWDRGIVERRSETFMGVIGAASGGPRLLADADCVVMAGAVPDYRVGFLQPPAVKDDAEIVYVESGWPELRHAYEDLGGRAHGGWFAEARRRRDEFRSAVEAIGARQAERGLHAIHIVAALREELDQDACLLIDGGSIGQWAHQLANRYPSRWLTCGRSGVVGWGLGGAMGARLALPEETIVLLSGDGAFTFTVAELESAARQKLHFVAIVADDQGWGITRTGHMRQFGEPIASALGPVAFDRLAESLGARGVAATTAEGLRSAIGEAIAEPAVTVIHAPIVGGNPA
jgi:acetolactate synthase-1/2/3 large subunit